MVVVDLDLDLESPCLAGVLLSEEWLPDYGLVDGLVESLRATTRQVGKPMDCCSAI